MHFLDGITGFSFNPNQKINEAAVSFNYADLDDAANLLDSKVAGDISNGAIKKESIESMQTVLDLIPYEALEKNLTDAKVRNIFMKFIDPSRIEHILEYSKYESQKLSDIKNEIDVLYNNNKPIRSYLVLCERISSRLIKLRSILAETANSPDFNDLDMITKKAKILRDIGALISDGTNKFKVSKIGTIDTDIDPDSIQLVEQGSNAEKEMSKEEFKNLLASSGAHGKLDDVFSDDNKKKIDSAILENSKTLGDYMMWSNEVNSKTLAAIDSESDADKKETMIEDALANIKDLTAAILMVLNREKAQPIEDALNQRADEVSPRATGSRVKNNIFKNLRNALATSLLPAFNSGQITAPGGYYKLFITLNTDNEERMSRVVRERVYRGDQAKSDEFLRSIGEESPEEAYQLDYLNASEQWIIDWVESDQDGTFPDKKAIASTKTIESLAEAKRKEIKNYYLSKGFNISKFAAFRIKPEIRLPLYQKVKLAVTQAERIAETPLGKIGKGLNYLYDATYTDGSAQGNHDQNKAIFRGFNKLFSSAVTLLGGKQAGRDYEKMIHKFSNSVLPLRAIGFTSEEPGKEGKEEIKEDMVAPLPSSGMMQVNPESPGTPFQTPATLPDNTMDTFALAGPQKKKDKDEKKVEATASAKIMNFKQFMKHAKPK